METCTLEQMADDVAALCEHLGIARRFVLRHSAGGCAFSRPEIGMMQHFMTTIGPSYDLRRRLAEITAPTLAVAGKYDWVCLPRASGAIAKGIPGAGLVELVELGDVGHFVFSEDPQRFLDVVTEFFARVLCCGRKSVHPVLRE